MVTSCHCLHNSLFFKDRLVLRETHIIFPNDFEGVCLVRDFALDQVDLAKGAATEELLDGEVLD